MSCMYQTTPHDAGCGRTRMRYLTEHTRPGDTYLNDWPVPMYQVDQMTLISTVEQDLIFALDTPVDEGSKDGSGASMVTDL